MIDKSIRNLQSINYGDLSRLIKINGLISLFGMIYKVGYNSNDSI